VQPARKVVLVFAGAPVELTRRLRARLAALEHPFVVAADGGAATALALGYQPDVIVGDFDSIDSALLAELEERGASVERYPRDKEATDGQLALDVALGHAPTQLVLVGFLGGERLDQAVANVLLLATAEAPAVVLDGDNEATLLRAGGQVAFNSEPGELVSLLPIGANAEGVRTAGLRWALDGERLEFGHTRGVSNEPTAPEYHVSLERGLLLVTRHFPRG
jgi:thiamine pyrophosphokinase